MKKRLNSLWVLSLILLSTYGCKQDQTDPVDHQNEIGLFSELIESVLEADSAEQYTIVEDFIDSLQFPFIEHDTTVYFLYSGNATSVSVAGDFTNWNPSGRSFTKLRDTELWYRREAFESDARLDYKIVVNSSNWILDPKNPNRIGGGFGFNSELAMPNYVQPWEIQQKEGIEKGTVTQVSLSSLATGENYKVHVYLPPGYNESIKYPVAYFQDGEDYISLAKATTVIDNLIDSAKMQPLIAVFVVPTDRNYEYAFEGRFEYTEFFVSELVPYVDSNYSTKQESNSRAVIGDSYGGNISAIIAFQNPDVFGNCGIHSGAFRQFNFHTNSIVMDGMKKDIRVASIWGTYEGSVLPSNMRKVRDYLIDNDYEVIWKELPEGHSWGLWRATLDDMLVFFFPA